MGAQKPDIGQLRKLFQTWQEQMQAGGGWNALFGATMTSRDQSHAFVLTKGMKSSVPRCLPAVSISCGGRLIYTKARNWG